MNVTIEKHGETKNGVFWCQLRIGELVVAGRSFKTESFDELKRDFKLIFDSQDDADAFTSLDGETLATVRREVKRAWMKTKQPMVEYVKKSRLIMRDEVII
jgi:hypothetical protein